MTAGIAKITMNDVTTIAQTRTGTRLSDMPTARCLKTVVMISTAPTSADISVSVTMSAQISPRFPGENCAPASGTYETQPTSGPVLQISAPQSSSPPHKYVQYPNALRRGNATLRVPTISGTRYSATPSITGTAKRNIIVVP